MFKHSPDPSFEFAAGVALSPVHPDEAEQEEEIVTDRFLWRRKATSRRLQKCRSRGQEKAPDFAPRFIAPRVKSHMPEFDQSLTELIGHVLPVRSPEAVRRERALIVTGCVFTVLLATASAAIMMRGPQDPAGSATAQMAFALNGERQDVLQRVSKTEAAVTLLGGFFKAETAQDKMRFVLGGDSMAPVLRDYYARHPDEPAVFTCTNTSTTAAGDREFYFIGGVLEDGAWVETVVEETTAGLKLDWSYLKGTGDQEWDIWIENHPPEPVSMRVLARLDDFYSGPFSNAEEWLCVKITNLAGTSSAWAYISREREEGLMLARKLANQSEPLRLRASFAFPASLPDGAGRAPQVKMGSIAPRGWMEDNPRE